MWKPTFSMMEQYDGFSVMDLVDDEFVHSSFYMATEYFKSHASIFGGRQKTRGQ